MKTELYVISEALAKYGKVDAMACSYLHHVMYGTTLGSNYYAALNVLEYTGFITLYDVNPVTGNRVYCKLV